MPKPHPNAGHSHHQSERAGEHVEQEQESDDDAVPHQVDVKAGLPGGAFVSAQVGLALLLASEAFFASEAVFAGEAVFTGKAVFASATFLAFGAVFARRWRRWTNRIRGGRVGAATGGAAELSASRLIRASALLRCPAIFSSTSAAWPRASPAHRSQSFHCASHLCHLTAPQSVWSKEACQRSHFRDHRSRCC